MEQATCTCCGKTKPRSSFYRDRSRPAGLQSWCKACRLVDSRKRYAENPQKFIDRNVRWEQKNRESSHARKMRWQENHPDAWRNADPAKARLRRKRWAKRNPQAIAEKEARRRARQRDLTYQPISKELLGAKVEYWGGLCWICGEGADTIDHVKPLGMGGAHLLCNLRPACSSCNQRKSARWPFPLSSRGALDALTGKQHSDGCSVTTGSSTPLGK